MDEPTPPTIYDELRDLLIKSDFAWVMENVEAKLQAGIPEEFLLPRFRETVGSVDPENKPKERKVKLTGIRELSEQERLQLLVAEIERCLIVPTLIASDLPKRLSTPSLSVEKIDLIDIDGEKVMFSTGREANEAPKHAQTLSRLLNSIEEEFDRAT